MIPDSMIAANPALGQSVADLVQKKMCRFCLSETENLVDIMELEGQSNGNWKSVLVTCFSASVAIADQLPKYVCERCCAFVKKCHDFQRLRRKAEWLLLTYPLLGSWTQSLDVPDWLRSAKKRQLEEMIVDSASVKKVCGDQSKGSGDKADSYNVVTIDLLEDSEVTPIGAIRVRSQESLAVASTLQSPTITSEDTLPPMVPQRALPPPYTAVQSTNLPSRQCSDQTVIQYGQQQPNQHHDQRHDQLHQTVNSSQFPVNPSTTQYLQYQSSYTFVQPYQQVQQPAPQPMLRQQLQQPQYLQYPSSQPVYSQNLPSTLNTSSAQTPTHQPYQQQVVPTYQPAAPQISTPQHTPVQQPLHQSTTTWYPPTTTSSSINLRCIICSYQFADPNHLNFHMRKHVGKSQQFRCLACGDQRFQGLAPLIAHIGQRHLHDTNGYCSLCGEQQQQPDNMMDHLKQHLVAKMTHACDFCLMIFTNRNARMEHVGRRHRAETWQAKQLNSNRV